MQMLDWFRFALCTVLLAFTPLAQAQDKTPVLLVVGDSVSAGYGLSNGQGWVELLTKKLATEGYKYRIVNASISGDTTAGGRARLPALLAQHKPAIVILELGGNDALRGGKLATTRDNLDAMVSASQSAGAKVLVVGMEIPPNYGPAYAREFRDVFTGVASTRKVPLVPSFFAGFGEDLGYFQADRIHPTAQAQARLLDNVWPQLAPLLRK
jgi:acyl-CoA thioesterase-1